MPSLPSWPGKEIATAACPLDATKERVKDAARAFARVHEIPIGKEIEDVMAALRFAGAIEEKMPAPSVREVAIPKK